MIKDYSLYLESGPQHRKTMVHVPELLGCIANGPTSEAAIEVTPEAIRAFQRFLTSAGEDVNPDAQFTSHVEQHITEGSWLGNGSPYVTFAPDLQPVQPGELTVYIARREAMRRLLAAWASSQNDAQLDAPAEGRTARAILLHVLGPTAAYASPVLGAIKGVSRLQTQAERGQVSLPDALLQTASLVAERLRATSADERSRVVERPKEKRTLRKALRRMLEHDWEHIAELSRRPGGPQL